MAILNFIYVALGIGEMEFVYTIRLFALTTGYMNMFEEIRYEYVCIMLFFPRSRVRSTYCCIYDFVVRHTYRMP